MGQREVLRADLELLLQGLFGLAESEGLGVLSEADFTWSQVRVTMLLAHCDRQSIGSVADKLGISIHSAGRTIEQLVDHGIVARRESSTDRRVKLVSLTPRGRELIDQHVAHKRKALQRFVDRLPEDRVSALAAAIRPILDGDYLQPGAGSLEPNRV